MADLSNLKIKDTYQLLLQADAAGNIQNLQGATPNPIIINGNLRYVDGNQQADYYLKSDGSGNASWSQVTVSGDIYISAATLDDTVLKLHTTSGTTINVPVSYWSTDGSGNYSNSGLTGNVGIGTSSPNSKLTVVGAVSATTDIVADGSIYSGSSKLESLFLTQASLSGSSTVDKVGTITTNQFTVWSDSNKTLKSIPNLRLQGSVVTGDIISGTTLSASTIYTSGAINATGGLYGDDLTLKGQAVLNYSLGNDRIIVGNKPTLIQGHLTTSTVTGDIISGTTLSAATVYNSGDVLVGGAVYANIFSIGDTKEPLASLTDNDIWIGNSNSLDGLKLGRNATDRVQIFGNTIAGSIVSDTFISGTTVSAVTLNIQNTLTAGNTTVGSLVATTLDTGQGANELYDMDQNVKTDSSVTFTSVDTGQGANELYAMNQDVQTTDAVTFVGITTNVLSGGTISATTVHASDVYGSRFLSNGYLAISQATGVLAFGNTDNQVMIDARTGGLNINGSITTLTNMSASGNISGATLQAVRKFTEPTLTDNSYQGDLIYNPPGASEYEVSPGNLYCLTGSTWVAADADIPNLSKGLLGLAVGASNINGFLIKGYYTLSIDAGTLSNPLFISATAGRMTDVAPSSTGQFVRVLGYVMDSSNGQVWFDPDKTWIELS
tara:strand:- start:15528 stop:17522 length:1995 start_codon:yes stop_codon:yes gene_type:complete